MFFAVAILIIFAGFDNDFYSGTAAKSKGKEMDNKEKEKITEIEQKKKAGKTDWLQWF